MTLSPAALGFIELKSHVRHILIIKQQHTWRTSMRTYTHVNCEETLLTRICIVVCDEVGIVFAYNVNNNNNVCVDTENTLNTLSVGVQHMSLNPVQIVHIQSLLWLVLCVCEARDYKFSIPHAGHKSDGQTANGHYCSSDWRVVNVCQRRPPTNRSCHYAVYGTCRISFEILSHHFALENKNQLLLMVKLFTINTKIKCKHRIGYSFTLLIRLQKRLINFVIFFSSKTIHKMILLYIVGFVAFVTFLLYSKWIFSYWTRRGVAGPAPIPIFGNMIEYFKMKKHFGEVYNEIYQ